MLHVKVSKVISDCTHFNDKMKERTKTFTPGCVKPALKLPPNQPGNQIRGQLIRSGTSVAARYRTSCSGRTVAQVVSKILTF